jgi:Spy/CpxP family protein refolding chaperone
MTLHAKTRLKIWLVLLCVFVIGSITGAAIDGFYRTFAGGRDRDRARAREKLFQETRRELNLSDEQAAKMRAILDQTSEEYRALRDELRPRFDVIRQKARARARETLSPEQQVRFDEMMARRDQKKQERHKEKQ